MTKRSFVRSKSFCFSRCILRSVTVPARRDGRQPAALMMWLMLFGAAETVSGAPAPAQSALLNRDGTTRVSLQVQLERGLRAMRPVEFKFLGEVLDQVKAGDLPKDMVEQAFLWAHRQRTYRVQYFEKALRALAKRSKIDFQTTVSSFDPGFNRK